MYTNESDAVIDNAIDTTVVMLSWSPDDYRYDLMRRSFTSLKENTHYPHTLVVVDNGLKKQTEYFNRQDIDIHVVNDVNWGIGIPRNMGAEQTDTEYLAFVDSDILFYPYWLSNCMDVLKAHPTSRLVATGRLDRFHRKTYHNSLNGCNLYERAGGGCVVMKRDLWQRCGKWSDTTTPGSEFCDRLRDHKGLFVWNSAWNCEHIGKNKSYHWRHILVKGRWYAKHQLIKMKWVVPD